MKNFITFLLLMLTVYYPVSATSLISIHQVGQLPTHNNIPIPADMPDVYYDNVYQTIIIDGTGEVTYYDVEILSLTTFDVVVSTQANGYYDTIDISSLSVGEYVIIIDSPTGNSFEGFLR